jgi:hypothetical protein
VRAKLEMSSSSSSGLHEVQMRLGRLRCVALPLRDVAEAAVKAKAGHIKKVSWFYATAADIAMPNAATELASTAAIHCHVLLKAVGAKSS